MKEKIKKIIAWGGVILFATGCGVLLTNAILKYMQEGGFAPAVVNIAIGLFFVGLVVVILTWSWLVPPTAKK